VSGGAAEALALLLLFAVLGAAVVRPRALNEAVFAVPAAGVLVAVGAEPVRAAAGRLTDLAPTVAFLVLILAFGHLCAEEGVFDYLGALAARASGGRAGRLLVLVVALAAVITAVLTLDATVVLLTPVVLRTTRRLGVPARPHLYACTQLANAGSLLLPVSNLTNLLAFAAADLSFARFTTLMALPWVAATVLEWAGLRLFFGQDVAGAAREVPAPPRAPRFGLLILGLTVAGFVGTSAVDVQPAWAAGAGLLLLAVPALARRRTSVPAVLRAANLGFGAFVLALGVVVDAVTRHGLGSVLRHLLPGGTSLPALLGVAFLAAALANVLNNLPATLALVPLTAGSPAAVLAVLIGVNVGPNATYAGSLATLLWRRLLPERLRPRATQFHAYGLVSVPVIIAVTTVLLWAVS
jgi:arsenical pump membrane protein